MSWLPLAFDTSPEIERLQVERWRRMPSEQKAALVAALTAAAFEMARAGVRHRHPGESEAAHDRRLAEILLGTTLAARAFTDISGTP